MGSRGPDAPRRREATVRVSTDVARRVGEGHPWIYRDALQGRQLAVPAGGALDVLDSSGHFVGRALYEPEGPVALRVFDRRPGQALDRSYVLRTLRRAARMRRELLDVAPDSCFRALAGDVEGLPAVNLDFYGRYAVLLYYSGVVEPYHDAIIAAIEQVWQPAGIYLQRRYQPAPEGKARPGAELLVGQAAPPEVEVREGRVRFGVDVSAPLGTGLFADMRLGRQAVGRLSPGRRVLNCFSYTGAFSVIAALHGASMVVSIDSASRAHARAQRNFALNSLPLEERTTRFVTGDTFAVLARFAARKEQYDLVVLDPPTFSAAGRGRPFTALRDYAELVTAALQATARGGVLCAASNAAKLAAADFERALARGAAAAGRELLVTERVSQPPDYPVAPGFPESNYLKFVVGRVT